MQRKLKIRGCEIVRESGGLVGILEVESKPAENP
jgi:hypothetical protein